MRSILLCLALAAAPGILSAQQATIWGRVKDPSGAVVPGAKVTVVKADTQALLETSSSDTGIYEFPSLQPGSYEIRVEKAGFQPLVRGKLTLHIGDRVQIDLELIVGDSKEAITVESGQEALNTVDGSVSTVIERQTVENMPLNGRSFQSLLNLTPGVNPINPMSLTPGNVQKTGGQFTVNGQRSDANYFMVDGVSANSGVNGGGLIGQSGTGSLPGTTALGGFNGLVSVDALQEFRIATSSFAPENGRTPGGQVLLLTRSGTNAFHGDVFNYFRNTALDANDWFLNRAGMQRGAVHQNDFGGVIGGPVIKDKLFFFLSYEGLRLTNIQPGTSFTFTRDARYLAARSANGPGHSGYMAQILNAYPLPARDPSTGDGSTCTSPETCIAPFTAAFPNHSRMDSGSARIDYTINSKLSLFARYVQSPSATAASGSLASINTTDISQQSNSGTVGLIHIISPSMNNDLRFGYSRAALRESLTAPNFTGNLASLFPAGFSQPPAGYSFDDMLLSFNYLGLGVPSLNIGKAASNNKQRQFNLVDTLGVTRGPHLWKFGVDLRQTDPSVSKAPYALQVNFYSALAPASCSSGPLPVPGGPPPPPPLPQFLCGKAANTVIQNNSRQDFRFRNWSLFAQDTWKITSRLNLTYGVRYEINPPPTSRNGKPLFSLSNWDPVQCTTTPTYVAGSIVCNVGIKPLGTPPYHTSWGNVAPRIGAAYQMSRSANWRSVLRAGFGIFYDTGDNAASAALGPYTPSLAGLIPGSPCTSSGAGAGGGFTTGGQYIQFPVSNPACITPPAVQTNIGPASPYLGVAQAVAPDLKMPFAYEWNASIQQALGDRQSLAVSYVGSMGKHLIGAVATGATAQLQSGVTVPISPTFSTFLVVYGNYAKSDYHALQAHFQRQFYRGIGATASYTWGHSLDDASNFNAGPVFPFSLNRSNSDFDIRQTFAASLVLDAPTPWKRSKLASAVLGHWSFAPIYHFQTAPPINPVAVMSASADETFTLTTRPNIIPGVPLYVDGKDCADEYGGGCPGGRALNNAGIGAPHGATLAQALAAGCVEDTVHGALCRQANVITPGANFHGQGTLGRNSLRGFHLQQLDLDIHRDFALSERMRLRFEGDLFNVFNHPNFASPSAVLTDANFGSSQGMMNSSFGSGNAGTGGGYNSLYTMGGPRAVQLAVKLIF
jgi:hypothetical protein